MTQQLLTTEEVAHWLNVSPRTITNLAERQELIGIKVGRQWRFTRRAVRDLTGVDPPEGEALT